MAVRRRFHTRPGATRVSRQRVRTRRRVGVLRGRRAWSRLGRRQRPDPATRWVLHRSAPALAVCSALAVVVVALRCGWSAQLPAFAVFAVWAVVLSGIDLALMRLPDALVLPAYPTLVVLLLLPGDAHAWVRALLAAGACLAVHFGFGLVGLGFGDVKASGVVGLVLGWLGWGVLVGGLVLAYLAAGVVAAVLLGRRSTRRGQRMPFGPFLLGGALVSALVAV